VASARPCINRVKRDDRLAVTRNTAIESQAHKPARKQSTKGDRENNKRRLSRHHACKRCHISKRGSEEKPGVLGPDFVVAAGVCYGQAKPFCEFHGRNSAAPSGVLEEQGRNHQNDRSEHEAPL
jgi:hypothetical protein